MALPATDLGVHSGKRILRQGMVELADIFPLRESVTLKAVGPETSLVLIFVTICAGLRNAEIRFAQVLNFYACAFALRHTRRRVTAVTLHSVVFALKLVACLAVIEGLNVKFDKTKAFAVVL